MCHTPRKRRSRYDIAQHSNSPGPDHHWSLMCIDIPSLYPHLVFGVKKPVIPQPILWSLIFDVPLAFLDRTIVHTQTIFVSAAVADRGHASPHRLCQQLLNLRRVDPVEPCHREEHKRRVEDVLQSQKLAQCALGDMRQGQNCDPPRRSRA